MSLKCITDIWSRYSKKIGDQQARFPVHLKRQTARVAWMVG